MIKYNLHLFKLKKLKNFMSILRARGESTLKLILPIFKDIVSSKWEIPLPIDIKYWSS